MELGMWSVLALGLVLLPSCQGSWACPSSCSCQLNSPLPQETEAAEEGVQSAPDLQVWCPHTGVAPASPPASLVLNLTRVEVAGARSPELSELLQGMPSLRDLNIRDVQDPTTAWHNLFQSGSCRNLSTLVIHHSRFKNLRSDTFVRLRALTYLDLRHNELMSTVSVGTDSATNNRKNDHTLLPKDGLEPSELEPGQTESRENDHTSLFKRSEYEPEQINNREIDKTSLFKPSEYESRQANNSKNGHTLLAKEGLKPSEYEPGQADEVAPFTLQLPPGLQVLLLSHNNIRSIAPLNSSSLTVLDLSYNLIAHLQPAQIALPQLRSLSVGGPKLSLQPGLLSPSTLPGLRELGLLGTAEHRLTLGRAVERDVGALVSQQLTTLTLHRCSLSSVALVTYVPGNRLQYLSVTHSTLMATRTRSHSFNMSLVASLNFEGTPFLAKNFLNPPGRHPPTPLLELTTLVVANADVKTLPVNILARLPQLRELDISKNPLHCTCENFAWVIGLVALNRLTLLNPGDTTCAYPAHLGGKLLLQEDLCKSAPTDATTEHQGLLDKSISSSVTRSLNNMDADESTPKENARSNLQQLPSEKKAPASLESNHRNFDARDMSSTMSAENVFVALLVVVAFLGLVVRGGQQWVQRNARATHATEDTRLNEPVLS